MNRLLHLGVGNFHRAHQAWYTQAANIAANENWRITGVSLRHPKIRDALQPQNYEYALSISDASSQRWHRISIHDTILVANENPGAVLAAMADASVKVITLTVTEKGYDLDTKGRLNLQSPAIAADLFNRNDDKPPGSTIGMLTAGLAARAANNAPVTVLSCDNLPANGAKLRAAVVDYANAAGIDLQSFLSSSTAFPSCMVDRITPASDEALRKQVAGSNLPSSEPVATEAFSEWVIEEHFAAERPAWDKAGAVFVDDVAPYELRKLRMLNGAHSYLAYAGALAGYDYVHQAIADPVLQRQTYDLMQEAASTLPASSQRDAGDYARALLVRFANSNLQHRLRQIAMDGSLKMPIRILSTRADRAANGLPSPACDIALAAWREFLDREFSANLTVEDPNADRLQRGITLGEDAITLLENSL